MDLINNLLTHKEYIPIFLAFLGSIYKLVEQFQFGKIKAYKAIMQLLEADKENYLYSSIKQAQDESINQWLFGGKTMSKNFAVMLHQLYSTGHFTKDEVRVFLPYLKIDNNQLRMDTPKRSADVWLAIILTAIVSAYLIPAGAWLMLGSFKDAPLRYFTGIAVIAVWAIYGRWALKPYRDYKTAKKHKTKLDELLKEMNVKSLQVTIN